MKKFIVIVLLVTLGLILTFTVSSAGGMRIDDKAVSTNSKSEREVKKDFDVKPGGKVTIDLKTGASIKIIGWDKDLLSAVATIKEDKENSIEFRFNKNGNDVEITSEYVSGNHNHSNAKLVVQVPNKYNVEFNTMGGAVTIENVEGNMEGKTMGGAISLSNLKGYINTETMGGAISLKDSEVDGKVKTMGGSVTVENVKGDVDATSMGGKIKQINVQGKNKSIGKEINISTMGGELDIDDAPNGAHLKTMGGNIHVNKAGKFVYAETMGGKIIIESVDGGVTASTMGGDVEVKMVGNPKEGDRDVTLSSKGGDITLTVPEGLSMDIDIQIAVADEDKSESKFNDYKIVSDFQIKEDRSGNWNDSKGTARKYIKGSGSIDGGMNKIKIRTINGNVFLKKG